MDVVQSNFLSCLPLIEKAINDSCFIAIDTEFTGLKSRPEDESSLFDGISDRYTKIKRIVQNFTICQFGLSAFVRESSNRYMAHSFNFFICPREQGSLNECFSIQASNAEFLCAHNFNFNKWFYEGIPYCTENQEAILKTEYNLEWHKMKIELIGFSHIFQLLVKAKKPLLGHNMLLDLAFMLQKFHKPLPANYEQFKKTVHSLFPVVMDTKNLCHGLRKKVDNPILEFSNLQELYDALNNKKGTFLVLCSPSVVHSDSTPKYDKDKCFHEAAFDAYCVGFVFLKIAHILAMKGVSSVDAHPIHVRQYFKLTRPYSNRINLSWGPVNYIDLVGPDPPPRQRGMLVVTSKVNKKITRAMLVEQLGDIKMEFQLVTPHRAIVILPTQSKLTQLLEKNETDKLTIRSYSTWRDTYLYWKLLLPVSGVLAALAAAYLAWKLHYNQ